MGLIMETACAGPAGHKAFAPVPMSEYAYELPILAGTKLSPTMINRLRAQLADFSFAVKADPPMPLTKTPKIAQIAMSALPAPVKP